MGAWADSGVLLLKLVASMAEMPSGRGGASLRIVAIVAKVRWRAGSCRKEAFAHCPNILKPDVLHHHKRLHSFKKLHISLPIGPMVWWHMQFRTWEGHHYPARCLTYSTTTTRGALLLPPEPVSPSLGFLQKAPQQLIQLVVNTHELRFHLLDGLLLPGLAGSDFCFHLLDGLAGSGLLLQLHHEPLDNSYQSPQQCRQLHSLCQHTGIELPKIHWQLPYPFCYQHRTGCPGTAGGRRC